MEEDRPVDKELKDISTERIRQKKKQRNRRECKNECEKGNKAKVQRCKNKE
jgi:hypothetical protein